MTAAAAPITGVVAIVAVDPAAGTEQRDEGEDEPPLMPADNAAAAVAVVVVVVQLFVMMELMWFATS